MMNTIKDFVDSNEIMSFITKENAVKVAATAASGLVVAYIV